jgi:hypothetical protein
VIEPRNVSAQLHHRAAGNPPSTLPDSAISNCFPGLEFDFRNLWRRLFAGIELHEARGFVTRADPPLERLAGRFLVQVGEQPILTVVHGPNQAGADDAVLRSMFLEWSNALAAAVAAGPGATVECVFDDGTGGLETVDLQVNPVFARSAATDEQIPLVDEDLVGPGELTQSLCSPWQNDYRECGCYYWAASRPDYVNVGTSATGTSVGNNWLARDRTPLQYDIPDDDQISYDELFRNWQGLLRFVVGGRDHD